MNHRWLKLCAALTVATALVGCVTLPPAPTLDEVVQMSKQGTPPAEIIQKMQAAHAVYKLSGSKLAALKTQGVADEVLDYMYDAYINSVRLQERELYMGYPPYDYPYYYPPYYYGPWPHYRHFGY